MTISHVLPEVMGSYKPEQKPQKKRVNRGYDIDRGWGGKTVLTDSAIKEIRWLYEFGGWSLKDIQMAYGLSYQYAYNISVYAARSKVNVKREDFPIGHRRINHQEQS